MIKAVIVDCFGVLYIGPGQQERNQVLLDFIQTLRPAHKIGILTNLSPYTMDNYFTQAERSRFFDDVVISSDVGLVKPEPGIYKLACDRLGVNPGECVFIDDMPENILGAESLGIRSILFTDTSTTIKKLQRMLQQG